MKAIATLICAFLAVTCFAQSGYSGQWKGTISQNSGGYRPQYEFEIYLRQKGNKLSGRSYVFVENIYAVVELAGEITGPNTIRIVETRIVDSKKTAGLEWCIKTYSLTRSKSGNTVKLSGPWTGHTNGTPCISGVVTLSRKEIRA